MEAVCQILPTQFIKYYLYPTNKGFDMVQKD